MMEKREIETLASAERLAANLSDARNRLALATSEAQEWANAAAADGVSEYRIAQALGVSRSTARTWLGKYSVPR